MGGGFGSLSLNASAPPLAYGGGGAAQRHQEPQRRRRRAGGGVTARGGRVGRTAGVPVRGAAAATRIRRRVGRAARTLRRTRQPRVAGAAAGARAGRVAPPAPAYGAPPPQQPRPGVRWRVGRASGTACEQRAARRGRVGRHRRRRRRRRYGAPPPRTRIRRRVGRAAGTAGRWCAALTARWLLPLSDDVIAACTQSAVSCTTPNPCAVARVRRAAGGGARCHPKSRPARRVNERRKLQHTHLLLGRRRRRAAAAAPPPLSWAWSPWSAAVCCCCCETRSLIEALAGSTRCARHRWSFAATRRGGFASSLAPSIGS